MNSNNNDKDRLIIRKEEAMLYTYPDYYSDFRCIADACEDTCCAGWQIAVDDKALRRYRREESPYKKKLRNSICWRKKVFRWGKEKRCAFLREDNLCDMYRNLGAESLCRTCRLYPRHIEDLKGCERYLCLFPVRRWRVC